MAKKHIFQIAVGTAGVALLATACSSSSDSTASPSSAATTETPAATTAAPTPTPTSTPAPTTTSASDEAPKPPSGSKELQQENSSGVHYARYSNKSESPKQVHDYYQKKIEAEGYKVTKSGGGGGGWGGYGGSDYGLKAEKSGSYFDVQAGGQTGKTTYFEVCLGPDESAVDRCDQHSKDSNSGGS